MAAVDRHRANEGGFRFETSAQLEEVENERIRLEKERRVRSRNVFLWRAQSITERVDEVSLPAILSFPRDRLPIAGWKPME